MTRLHNRISYLPTSPGHAPGLFLGSSAHDILLQHEADTLLRKGAIKHVPALFIISAFYSPYVSHPDEGRRPPLCPRSLLPQYFHQKDQVLDGDAHFIIPSLPQLVWFAALDMKDAYFHIKVHLAHREFLHFCVSDNHYQLWVLAFSIATVSGVFTKVFAGS